MVSDGRYFRWNSGGFQVKVLSQLRHATLHRRISEWVNRLCKECPQFCPMSCDTEDCLPQIVHSACYHGAAALSGLRCTSDRSLKDACITSCVGDSINATVIKGHVALVDGTQNRVDVLVPTVPAAKRPLNVGQMCLPSHPGAADLLTMLVFALPPAIWGDVRNAGVREEMTHSVSTTNLPLPLRTEVSCSL